MYASSAAPFMCLLNTKCSVTPNYTNAQPVNERKATTRIAFAASPANITLCPLLPKHSADARNAGIERGTQ